MKAMKNSYFFKKTAQYLCKYTGLESSVEYQSFVYCGHARYLLWLLANSVDWQYYSSRFGNFRIAGCSVQILPASNLVSKDYSLSTTSQLVLNVSSSLKFGAFCYDPASNLSPLSDRLIVGSIVNRPGTLLSKTGFKVNLKIPSLPLLPVASILASGTVDKYGVVSHAFDYALQLRLGVSHSYAVVNYSFKVEFADPSISGFLPNDNEYTQQSLVSVPKVLPLARSYSVLEEEKTIDEKKP